MTVSDALDSIEQELLNAIRKHNKMKSPHEGYAIILEELDELWDEIKKQYDVRTKNNMRLEAKQVAAMAARFMVDLT